MNTTISTSPNHTMLLQDLKKWCGSHKPCAIAYRQSDGSTLEIASEIIDIFSWQGKDYILIEKGQLLCLDRLVGVSA